MCIHAGMKARRRICVANQILNCNFLNLEGDFVISTRSRHSTLTTHSRAKMSTQQLLKCAFPLIRTHGFTRQALSQAALSLPKPSEKPLSDTAVSALFGDGEEARRTLLNAWLAEGRKDMEKSDDRSISGLLKYRLRWNEPVLQYLPEVC